MFDDSDWSSSAPEEAQPSEGREKSASSPITCEKGGNSSSAGMARSDAARALGGVGVVPAAENRWPSLSSAARLSRKLDIPAAEAEPGDDAFAFPAAAVDGGTATATLEYLPPPPPPSPTTQSVRASRPAPAEPSIAAVSDQRTPQNSRTSATKEEAAPVAAATEAIPDSCCCSSPASSPFLTTTAAEGVGDSDVELAKRERRPCWRKMWRASSWTSFRASACRTALLPAATQATPLGLNRYWLLLVHVLYVFASARLLFGWPNLSNMLFRSGAYAWLCSGAPEEGGSTLHKRYLCRAQDNAVQLLFTVGVAVAFCCSLLSGLFMDWRGPRLCAVVGQLLNTLGWIFFAIAGESCQTYFPAVLCLALGGDAGYLPSLTVSNLFPGHEGMVVVTLSAAMSASFSIPTLMDISWKNHLASLSFKTVCLIYAGLGSGLCALTALLLFPTRPYASQEEIHHQMAAAARGSEELVQPLPGEESAAPALGESADTTAAAGFGQDDDSDIPVAQAVSASTSVGVWSHSGGGGENKEAAVQSRKRELEKKGNAVAFAGSPASLSSAYHGEGSCVTGDAASEEAEKGGQEEETQEMISTEEMLPFRRQVLSQYFLCFFVYWPLNALFYNFYVTSAENMFNSEVNNLLGILGPVSMVPSILLGKLADLYGVMSLVLFISCSGVCMYFFALLSANWAFVVSAVFSCLYISNFSGQMYAYMQDTFQSSDFGKVVGFTSAAGGLFALLRIPLHDHFTVTVLQGDYRRACGLMLGVTLFCLLLAIRLFILKRKNNKAYYKSSHRGDTATAAAGARTAIICDKQEEQQRQPIEKDTIWEVSGGKAKFCEV